MALVLAEEQIQFLPVGINRLEVTVMLPIQTQILALLQDERLGARILTRKDPNRPLEERHFVALQVGTDLIATDQQAHYVGSFEGYYRSIDQPPPEEGEPAPPPIVKQEVYHVFELTGPLHPASMPAPEG